MQHSSGSSPEYTWVNICSCLNCFSWLISCWRLRRKQLKSGLSMKARWEEWSWPGSAQPHSWWVFSWGRSEESNGKCQRCFLSWPSVALRPQATVPAWVPDCSVGRTSIKALGCNGRKAAGPSLPDHHLSFFLSCLGVIGLTSVLSQVEEGWCMPLRWACLLHCSSCLPWFCSELEMF